MATTKKVSGAAAKKPAAKATAGKTPNVPSFDDLTKLVQGLKLPNIDMQALAEWQRKDMETLAEANSQAYEGIQALVSRRNEILRETLAQWQDALKNPVGKDGLAGQADAAKAGVQQAVTHFRELAAMEAETRKKTWKVVQDRMQENMVNLQKLLLPKK